MGLNSELSEASQALAVHLKQRSEQLQAAAEQKKRALSLQVDQELQQQTLQMSREHNDNVLMLQQANQQHKLELKRQSTALLMDYYQNKAQEDFIVEQQRSQRLHVTTQLEHRESNEELKKKHEASAREAMEAHAQCSDQMQALQQKQTVLAQEVALQRSRFAHITAAVPQLAASSPQFFPVLPTAPQQAWAAPRPQQGAATYLPALPPERAVTLYKPLSSAVAVNGCPSPPMSPVSQVTVAPSVCMPCRGGAEDIVSGASASLGPAVAAAQQLPQQQHKHAQGGASVATVAAAAGGASPPATERGRSSARRTASAIGRAPDSLDSSTDWDALVHL